MIIWQKIRNIDGSVLYVVAVKKTEWQSKIFLAVITSCISHWCFSPHSPPPHTHTHTHTTHRRLWLYSLNLDSWCHLPRAKQTYDYSYTGKFVHRHLLLETILTQTICIYNNLYTVKPYQGQTTVYRDSWYLRQLVPWKAMPRTLGS